MHAIFYFYRTRNRKTAKHPILENNIFRNPDFSMSMQLPWQFLSAPFIRAAQQGPWRGGLDRGSIQSELI